ncbi:MAG: OmpA family protein, partial [Odoribacter sp.]|nr:OmpA family protein [Odoribacter sp.]
MRYLIFLCGVVLLVSACSSRYYMKRGNVIYETGRYVKAASKYEKSYNKTKKKPAKASAAFRVAEAHEKVNHLKEAYSWYGKARLADKEQPGIYLKLAEISSRLDEEENARDYYKEYEELVGDGKGNDGIYYLERVAEDKKQEGRYVVQPKKEFNSRYSDFTPVYVPDDTCVVYLASARPVESAQRVKADPITGGGYSHIYQVRYVQDVRTVDKDGKVKVKHFKEPRWLKPVLLRDSLYSARHDGAMCFTHDGQHMYFTSSRPVKGSHIGTRIYRATLKTGEDKNGVEKKGWTEIVPSGICGDSVCVGHPALTPDGKRMYFVSDALPGGFGGKDIWYADLEDGKWSAPVNAGEGVNTEGDEMFPYVRDNGELYFASNGRYGFGGLDLYKVEQKDGKERVVHLPAPLNSYGDDFAIIFKPGEEKGWFCSSRSGRSDNIFDFSYLPQQLQVRLLVSNAVTELPVAKAEVAVTADDGTVVYLETDSLGRASMPVVAEKEYVFVCEHVRYLKGKGVISTYREKKDRSYELVINMQPIEKPIVIPNIYFDVAKWDLREDAMKNLEQLLEILKDNPNIVIELSAHTDMVGNDRANMVLSQNRARSVVDYLIEKGIYWDRLEAKGYGETRPREINEKDVREYDFLKVGDILNERFVNRLRGGQKEIAMQLNRRIEFK